MLGQSTEWFDIFIAVSIVLFLVAAYILRKAHSGYTLAMVAFAVFSGAFLFAGPPST